MRSLSPSPSTLSASRRVRTITSRIARSFPIARHTAGGSNAACWTQLASIAIPRPPAASLSSRAVRMNTPLGMRPRALPTVLRISWDFGSVDTPEVVAARRLACYFATVSDDQPHDAPDEAAEIAEADAPEPLTYAGPDTSDPTGHAHDDAPDDRLDELDGVRIRQLATMK